MGKIFIEGTPVALSSGSGSGSSGSGGISISGHLLLIYQDDAGNEFVVRGGPTTGGDPDYGPLIIEQNVPIDESVDRRIDSDGNPVTPASRGNREILLDGRSAEDAWSLILQQAANIDTQSFAYSPTGKNSNGTVGNLLYLIGIDVNDVLPDPDGVMIIPFSGKDEEFEFDYVINGTEGDDVIKGRGGIQTFNGAGGNDDITGGKADDILDGGAGQDEAFYEGSFADYDLEFLPDNVVRITDKVGDRDGVDTLTNFEFGVFSDKSVNIGPGQDIAFVIDTTGSMFDDIDAVKARAGEIINAIFDGDSGILNSRIAVVGYNDPETETFLSFTDQPSIEDRKTAAIDAINSISVGGGGDFPEAVNAGLLRALDGRAGEWREDAIARRIILFGDAPPNDEELRAQVLALAADVGTSIEGEIATSTLTSELTVTRFSIAAVDAEGNPTSIPVEIFTVLIGDDPTTRADFEELATETGGEFFTAADSSEVVDAIIDAIEAPVNFAPTGATLSNAAIDENTSSGFVVGELTAIDPDTTDTHTFTLIDNAGGAFIIDGKTLVVAEGAVLDFETTPTIDIVVEVTDNAGESVEQTLTITLNDIAEESSIDGTNAADNLKGTSNGDVINGLGGNDTILAFGGNDVVVGGSGNDSITGGGGKDTLDGGDGKDFLKGGGENDLLTGGSGNDTLEGEDGQDVLKGGTGNDVLFGGNGKDTLEGEEGNDNLSGGDANDSLSGGIGSDTLDGGEGQDTLFGGDGSDLMTGGNGNDALDGGEGIDILSGGGGNDLLTGGNGNDTLTGGTGNDSLYGGNGFDIFGLTAGDGTDTVFDYQTQDSLGLAGGLTFEQLIISQGIGQTEIKITETGEVLALLTGVQASSIGIEDFVLL